MREEIKRKNVRTSRWDKSLVENWRVSRRRGGRTESKTVPRTPWARPDGHRRVPYSRPQDIRQLEKWLTTASLGAWCLYWDGYLARDKADERPGFGGTNLDYPARRVGRLMWQAYAAGRVELWQSRVGPNRFRYWARRVRDLPLRDQTYCEDGDCR